MRARSAFTSVLKVALVATALFAAQGRAAADSLTIELVGLGAGQNDGNFFAGVLKFIVLDGQGHQTGKFDAFCVDINHDIHIGSTYHVTVETDPPPITLNGNSISSTKALAVEGIAQDAISSGDNQKSADAQRAIWNILFNRTPSSPGQYYNNYVNSYTQGPALPSVGAYWLDSGPAGPGQSMVVPLSAHPNIPVPEPSSLTLMALLGTCVLGGGYCRRLLRRA
jgi:hypothetical protein